MKHRKKHRQNCSKEFTTKRIEVFQHDACSSCGRDWEEHPGIKNACAELIKTKHELRETIADRDSWMEQAEDRLKEWHDLHKELSSVMEKWQNDKALLWAAVRIIQDKGLTVTSTDLIKVAKEIEETKHKLFLAEERLREEGILDYGNKKEKTRTLHPGLFHKKGINE